MARPKKELYYILLFLIVAGIHIYVRLFPSYLPQLRNEARVRVETEIMNEAISGIDKLYPDFNPGVKVKLADEIFREETRKSTFKKRLENEYEKLKEPFQDPQGQMYLLETDPYCRLRFTRLVLEYGYPGNNRIGDKIYDMAMLAPRGAAVAPHRFLYYLSAFLYRITSFIIPGLSLKQFVFYLSPFFSFLFYVLLYVFCRRYFSHITGIGAVLFMGLAPIVIMRSSAGWFDTDMLNALFPLAVILCLIRSLESGKKRKIVSWALGSSFFLALFAFTWVGWWFVYIVALGFFAYTFLNRIVEARGSPQQLKNMITPYGISLGSFLVGSVFFCFLIAGIEPLSFTYHSIAENLGLGKSFTPSIWPLVEYTVEELQKGDASNIPGFLGGKAFSILAMISWVWVFLRSTRVKGARKHSVIMLSFWAFFMCFASMKGTRFAFYLVIPLSVFFGAGLSELIETGIRTIRSSQNIKMKAGIGLGLCVFLYSIISPSIQRGMAASRMQVPFISDARYNILTKIRESTPPDSILNSWWDYGNEFKEIARRRTIVDPQSQNNPITYWMAKALISENEEYSIRVLRMINNSSDDLFDEVQEFVKDEYKTIMILKRVLEAPAHEVDNILGSYKLPDEIKEKLRNIIFTKKPAPAYFIMSGDILNYAMNISFLGNWNFPKVYIMQHSQMSKQDTLNGLEDIFSLSAEEGEAFYNEVMTAMALGETNEVLSKKWGVCFVLGKGKEEDGVVCFNNGLIFKTRDLTTKAISDIDGNYRKLEYVFAFDGEKLEYKDFSGSKDPLIKAGCFIFKRGEEWRSIGLTSREMGKSLLAKLYFTKGKGLKYFEPFIFDDEAGIYVYRILWDKASKE